MVGKNVLAKIVDCDGASLVGVPRCPPLPVNASTCIVSSAVAAWFDVVLTSFPYNRDVFGKIALLLHCFLLEVKIYSRLVRMVSV